jgi:O-antigen/teichoic acid export membrane protein
MFASFQALSLKTILRGLCPNALHPLWDRVEASPTSGRLVRGAFWAVAGTMISRFLGLASSIFAARIVGKLHYGELGMLQNTVGMFGILAGFGMGLTATKYVAEFRTKDPAKAGRIIALSSLVAWATSLALALALVVAAPWLCRHTIAAPQLTGLLQVSALLLLFSGINGAQTGALSGFEAFKRLAQVNFFVGLLSFPLTVCGAWFFGLPGILWGLIAAQAAACALNFFALRLEARRYAIHLSYSSCTAELPVIWRFSVPAVLGGIVVSPVNWACTAMLVRQPHGYAEMGAFNAANQWFNALMWLPSVLGQAALPMLAERFGAKDTAHSGKLLALAIKINAGIVLPLVLLGSLISPYIMASYGKDFASAWPTLIAVLLTAGLLALQTPVGQVIAASGRMWLGLAMNLGWALVFLLCTWLLTSKGALGLASARLLAYVAHALWTFAYAYLLMRHNPRK